MADFALFWYAPRLHSLSQHFSKLLQRYNFQLPNHKHSPIKIPRTKVFFDLRDYPICNKLLILRFQFILVMIMRNFNTQMIDSIDPDDDFGLFFHLDFEFFVFYVGTNCH